MISLVNIFVKVYSDSSFYLCITQTFTHSNYSKDHILKEVKNKLD